MIARFIRLVVLDWCALMRRPAYVLMPMFFTVMTLFVASYLGHGQIGAFIYALILMFVVFMSQSFFWHTRADQQALYHCYLSGFPISLMIFARIIAVWDAVYVPVILVLAGAIFMQDLQIYAMLHALALLLPLSVIIVLICALSAIFTVGRSASGLLGALLFMPLLLSIMILFVGGLSGAYLFSLYALWGILAAMFVPTLWAIKKIIELQYGLE